MKHLTTVSPANGDRPLLGGPGWRWKTCASCGKQNRTVVDDGGVCRICYEVYGVTYGPDGWAIPNYILLSQRPR